LPYKIEHLVLFEAIQAEFEQTGGSSGDYIRAGKLERGKTREKLLEDMAERKGGSKLMEAREFVKSACKTLTKRMNPENKGPYITMAGWTDIDQDIIDALFILLNLDVVSKNFISEDSRAPKSLKNLYSDLEDLYNYLMEADPK
jgi:hypothetical protein